MIIYYCLCSILSVRELRTLLVKLSTLPVALEDIEKFENMLKKCGRSYNGSPPSVDPIEYETHYDPELVSIKPNRINPIYYLVDSHLNDVLNYAL